MKFASLGHLIQKNDVKSFPKEWIQDKMVISPEMNINGVKGHIAGLLITAKEIMTNPIDEVRHLILETIIDLQENYGIDLIQLGALTTSVTAGGTWIADNKEFKGFVNHGDSYTTAITCSAVEKILKIKKKDPSELTLAIVGAYGIIGEMTSVLLIPKFSHSLLIGRRQEKLNQLEEKLTGNFSTSLELNTINADVIVTATNHPTSLLNSNHLKKNAIVVDVSQPPNISFEVCQNRSDIIRVDGGFVDFPIESHQPVPGVPPGKLFACIAEVIMQAMENEKRNHVGSIQINHLKKTMTWGNKYGFVLNELTNFGKPL